MLMLCDVTHTIIISSLCQLIFVYAKLFVFSYYNNIILYFPYSVLAFVLSDHFLLKFLNNEHLVSRVRRVHTVLYILY